MTWLTTALLFADLFSYCRQGNVFPAGAREGAGIMQIHVSHTMAPSSETCICGSLSHRLPRFSLTTCCLNDVCLTLVPRLTYIT